MKKLNRTELDVLAKRIGQDIRDAAEVAQEESDVIADKKNLPVATLILGQLNKLDNVTKKYLDTRGYNSDISKVKTSNILATMRPIQTKVKSLGYHNKEIFDSLVIGQISSPDVDSLVKLVAKQFIK